MKRATFSLGVLYVSAALSGCGHVTSANPALNVASGEVWYTKDVRFLVIELDTDIYYCPKGGETCYRAQIR